MTKPLSPPLPESPTQVVPQPDPPPSSPSPQPSVPLPPPGGQPPPAGAKSQASLPHLLPLPDNHQPEPLFSPAPPSPKRRSSPWVVALLVVLLVALPIALGLAYQAGRNSASQASVKPEVTVVIETPTPGQETPSPTQPTPTVTPQPSPGWQDLQVFTGTAAPQSTTQQTAVFTTPAEWRIVWQETMAGAGLFELELYTSTGQFVDLIGGQANQSATATYDVHARPGSFYFRITSDSASYKVEVQV
jgi:hypothetical protein